VVLEPVPGGDLEARHLERRVVEQIKTRSSDRPWSVRQFVREVLPDLYKQTEGTPADSTYRFVTDGRQGRWGDVEEFLRELKNRSDVAPTDLPNDECIRFGNGDAKTKRDFVVTATDEIRTGLETDSEAFERTIHLLSNLQFEWERSRAAVKSDLKALLRPMTADEHVLENKLEALVGHLLKAGSRNRTEVDIIGLLDAADLNRRAVEAPERIHEWNVQRVVGEVPRDSNNPRENER
jgi:hypothetical protein